LIEEQNVRRPAKSNSVWPRKGAEGAKNVTRISRIDTNPKGLEARKKVAQGICVTRKSAVQFFAPSALFCGQ
jgi:hypothetical protein